MRKTVTITIGGALFHIEEEAYATLDQYLRSVRQHFATYPDHEEIVSDIESRIAEEFAETLKDKKRAAVSQADVHELIARMGTVEDFREFASPAEPAAVPHEPDETRRPRLYRDADDVILGGVGAGIAKYLGIDPLIIRLLFALSILIGGFGVLLYVLLWIFLPVAKTASEKVEMTQGKVTLSAIEQRVNAVVASEKTRSTARRIVTLPVELLRRVFRLIAAVLRVLVPIVLRLIGLVIAVVACIGMVAATFWFLVLLLNPSSPYIGFPLKETVGAASYAVLLVSGWSVVLIPLVLLFLLAISMVFMRRVATLPAFIALTGTWIMALLAAGVTGFSNGPTIEAAAERYMDQELSTVTRSYDLTGFTGLEGRSDVRVTVSSGTGYVVRMTGREEDLAGMSAQVSDGVLLLDPQYARTSCLIFCRGVGMSAEVVMPSLASVHAGDASRFTVSGFVTKALVLTATDAGRLEVSADAETLEIRTKDVGRVTVKGKGGLLRVTAGDASRVEAYDFAAASAEVQAADVARVMVHASGSLTGKASDASRVLYRVSPATLDIQTSDAADAGLEGDGGQEW